MSDDLRKLAATGELCGDPCKVKNVESGCHCAMVLGMLDRIEELEAANSACVNTVAEWGAKAGALQAEVDHCRMEISALCGGDYDQLVVERDEAREAVQRLAGAMKRWDDHTSEQCPDSRGCWCGYEHAKTAIADPVVKRIVEVVSDEP